MSMKTYRGSCHCGAVRFEADIDLGAGLAKCNCSLCTKARAWFAFVKPERLRLLAGAEAQADYQWVPPGRPHPFLRYHFCKTCGIRTFGQGGVRVARRGLSLHQRGCAGRRRPRRAGRGPHQVRRRPARPLRPAAGRHPAHVGKSSSPVSRTARRLRPFAEKPPAAARCRPERPLTNACRCSPRAAGAHPEGVDHEQGVHDDEHTRRPEAPTRSSAGRRRTSKRTSRS